MNPIESSWPRWFVEALSKFASEVYRSTGNKGVARVELDPALAWSFGLASGESAQTHTACGYVEVAHSTRPHPRPSSCLVIGHPDPCSCGGVSG